jgi:WD40 repeat protein
MLTYADVCRYDPSGKLLASSDAVGVVRLWSSLQGVMVAELRGGHVAAVLALEFSGIRSAVYLLY